MSDPQHDKSNGDITVILQRWTADRSAALEELTPIVYVELRKIAASFLRREHQNNTLQPTALIHEAYLRLVNQDVASMEDRSHFYGVAARLMRQILVDAARARLASKRNAGQRLTLDERVEIKDDNRRIEFLALNEALGKLAEHSARTAEIVELRYFGGLRLEEIAAHLSISLATVKRNLKLGELWLREVLGGG